MVVFPRIQGNNSLDSDHMGNHYLQYRLCAIILHFNQHQHHKLINASNIIAPITDWFSL